MNRTCTLLFLLLGPMLFAQMEFPEKDFRNPLEVPIILSGTFGELRNNHFHSGLDIKTQQVTGLSVVASAAGNVSRIKVEHFGYGKALYIEHPNGYTTVYAHLEKFSPRIEAYVKAKQYEKESYEIELFPNIGELEVSQGELVAYSGNTGGSGGPHLHFEIRDKNERPLNPQLFGLTVADSKEPRLNDLMVYPLGESSHINRSNEKQKLRFTKQADGSYLSEKIEAYGAIGFGVGTVDQLDDAYNQNGIYKIETYYNGDKNLEVVMDKFSFAETRYLNRMIDFDYYEKNKKRIQKLFIERNNPLSIFTFEKEKGILNLTEEGFASVYNISIYDFKGNRTSLVVPIAVKKDSLLKPKEIITTPYFVRADQSFELSLGKFDVYIPEGTFYDDYYLDIAAENDRLKLHRNTIPLHKYLTLSYDVSAYSPLDREKLYIGSVGYKDKLYYTGSELREDRLTAATRSLGEYKLGMDTKPPLIISKALTDGKWMSAYKQLEFKIRDEESGIKSFRATINGKFALMEYEYKTDTLTYNFTDGITTDTENEFKLIVTDNVGNSATFTATFYRK